MYAGTYIGTKSQWAIAAYHPMYPYGLVSNIFCMQGVSLTTLVSVCQL